MSDADARYIKMNDAIMGDGSVFTGTQALGKGSSLTTLANLSGLIKVEATDVQFKVTNVSSGNLTHTACGIGGAGGTLAPGASLTCATGEAAQDRPIRQRGRACRDAELQQHRPAERLAGDGPDPGRAVAPPGGSNGREGQATGSGGETSGRVRRGRDDRRSRRHGHPPARLRRAPGRQGANSSRRAR